MIFVAGALVGLIVGFGAAIFRARRARELGISTVIAAIALVVAAIALARSGENDHTVATPAPEITATTQTTAPAVTTSAPPVTTAPAANVRVPNLVGQARGPAVAALSAGGLRVSIEALAFPNVPPGFVISQNPQPASTVAHGTIVTLVVSAAK